MPPRKPPQKPKPTFLIIDGHSQFYRAFFSPSPELNSPVTGETTTAIYIFMKIFCKLIRRYQPDYLAIAWDGKRTLLKRSKIYPDYKARRGDAPEGLFDQLDRVKAILSQLGVCMLKVSGYEADDIIATLVDICSNDQIKTVIVSRDKDLEPLLSGNVVLFDPFSDETLTHNMIEAKRGVKLNQLVDYWTMVGDASDNLPGVKGVGPKTAVRLLGQFGSFDNLIMNLHRAVKAEFQPAFTDPQVAITRQLLKLERNVPLEIEPEDLEWDGLDLARAKSLFKQLGFKNWLKWSDAD